MPSPIDTHFRPAAKISPAPLDGKARSPNVDRELLACEKLQGVLASNSQSVAQEDPEQALRPAPEPAAGSIPSSTSSSTSSTASAAPELAMGSAADAASAIVRCLDQSVLRMANLDGGSAAALAHLGEQGWSVLNELSRARGDGGITSVEWPAVLTHPLARPSAGILEGMTQLRALQALHVQAPDSGVLDLIDLFAFDAEARPVVEVHGSRASQFELMVPLGTRVYTHGITDDQDCQVSYVGDESVEATAVLGAPAHAGHLVRSEGQADLHASMEQWNPA